MRACHTIWRLASCIALVVCSRIAAAADLDPARLNQIAPTMRAFVDQGEIAGAGEMHLGAGGRHQQGQPDERPRPAEDLRREHFWTFYHGKSN